MDKKYQPSGLAIFAALLNGLLGLGLLWAAVLRETTVFWLNAGGYPVWLREAVLILFYPLLLVFLGSAFATVWLGLKAGGAGGRWRGWWLGIFLAQGLLLGIIVTVVAWNNVDNLINGRPLHAHGE